MSFKLTFKEVADAALARAGSLLAAWLPGGAMEGHEYKAKGFEGGKGRSLSVNCKTGMWGVFDRDEAGGDLISLYAAMHSIEQKEALVEVAAQCGLANDDAASPARAQPLPAPTAEPLEDKNEGWSTLLPVPAYANTPSHYSQWRKCEPRDVHVYTNRAGELLGYVRVYPTSDGGKMPVPLTFCTHATKGSAWKERAFEEPRPLFLGHWPRGVELCQKAVVVEGEPCAKALAALAVVQAAGWCVVTWPGGAAVPQKADWSGLGGAAQVVLWPDCDSQTEARPRAKKGEPELCGPLLPLPLLPEDKQPGVKAMLKVQAAMHEMGVLDVRWVAIPPPGEVESGWDVKDEIKRGDTPEAILAKIDAAQPRPPAAAKSECTPGLAGAGVGGGDDGEPPPGENEGTSGKKKRSWRDDLLTTGKGAIKPVRANAVLAFEQAPELKGLLGFNEFTNNVELLRDAPWGAGKGAFGEVDELHLGDYLVRALWLPDMARQTLDEAVRTVADRNRFHPVRAWLDTLAWDGTPRLNGWIMRACKAQPHAVLEAERKYLKRISAWFLMAMVKRAVEPGCKFDYMVIFEGNQGICKSTLLKVLGGPWFADTGLQLGDKDSYQNLQGKLLYEFGELDSLGKAEVTRIKAFTASSCDRFRASFDRRARDYPRQCCFAGTTNESQYLTDTTGNRRTWPVSVDRVIDIDWVTANRAQLFAEAAARVAAGERIAPTREEEELYFKRQQNDRVVDNVIEQQLMAKLLEPEQQYTTEFTLARAMMLLGVDMSKTSPGRHFERQVGSAFKRFGWPLVRSSTAGRPRVYKRPDIWPRPDEPEDLPTNLAPAQLTPSAHGTDQPPAPAVTESDDDLPF